MSGFGIATNGWQPQKIRFGARPPVGGAMCVSGAFTWAAPNMGAAFDTDIGVFGSSFDAIVSVEIDNRKNGYAVKLAFPDTDQTIVCPPFGRVCQPAATAQLKLSASLILDPSIVAAQAASGLSATTKIRAFNIYTPETYEHPEYVVANDILVPKREAVTSIAGTLISVGTTETVQLYSSQIGGSNVPLYTVLKSLRSTVQATSTVASDQSVQITLTDSLGLGHTFGTWNAICNANQPVTVYPDLVNLAGSELAVRGELTLSLICPAGVTAWMSWNFAGLSTNYPNFIWGPNG